MVKKTKEKVKTTSEDIKKASKSFAQFIEATALLVLVVAGFFLAYKHLKGQIYFYPVLVAAVVVSLRAAHEYWKHFTGKE